MKKELITQKEWDSLLVDCFYNHPDAPMYRLTESRDLAELSHLLRIPEAWHLNMVVTRFICAQIPKLGVLLWKHDAKRAPDIITALGKSKINTNKKLELNSRDKNKEQGRLRKNKNELRATSNTKREIAARINGTDWETCK